MKWNAPGAVAILLFGGLTAVGCSHLWEELEPLPGGTSTASTGGAGGSGTGSSSSGSGSGSGGSTGVTTVTYKATFAGCNSDMNLDIVACEMIVGGGGIMNIDGVTTQNTITRGFVRFDLDGALSGKTIDSVRLRLVTADVSNAQSEMSGAIWEVAPFTKASLGMAQPAELGTAVALDLGAVVPSHEYLWELPAKLVAPNKPVYLGIRTAAENGVDYWNDHGVDPPRLIVDYH